MVAETWTAPGRSPIVQRYAGWMSSELDRAHADHPGLVRLVRAVSLRPAPVLALLAAVSAALVTATVRPSDAWLFVRAASAMLGPDFFDVFADPVLQVGPLFLVGVGLVARAAEMVGLPPAPVVAGVQAGLVAWLGVAVAAAFARDGGRDPRPAQWAVGGALVVGGLLTEGVGSGHPEEIALGLLLAVAARAAARGSGVRLGLVIGLATGVKAWGLLGAPLALHGRRVRQVLLAAGACVLTVALCYFPFFVWGHVATFSFRWDSADGSSLLRVAAGQLGMSDWGMRVVQGAAAAGAGALVARRRRGSPLVVVVTVVAVRLLLDPVRLTYYTGPLVAAVVLWAWTAQARPGVVTRIVLLAAVPLVVVLPYVLPTPVVDGAASVLYVVVPLAVVAAERRAPAPSASGSPTAP
ncbi:MAG: hypothetical protein J7523_18370 [Cellulomonas sp.]|nr:hypothetical protein [Cellulomonas sp.]